MVLPRVQCGRHASSGAIEIDTKTFEIEPGGVAVKLANLPPAAAIASRILALTANPDVDMNQLAEALSWDAAFASDILVVANSALFGLSYEVTSLRRAITVLGLTRLNTLAVTVAIRGFLGSGGEAVASCWRHTAASAIIASAIAPSFSVSAETAFTVTLIHDIGRLGLLKTFPVEYASLLRHTLDNEIEGLRAEKLLLKVDHAAAGAWLLKTWPLPGIFVRAAASHHDPITGDDAELYQVVKASCRLAAALGFSAVEYRSQRSYSEILEMLPTDPSRGPLAGADELREIVAARLKGFV